MVFVKVALPPKARAYLDPAERGACIYNKQIQIKTARDRRQALCSRSGRRQEPRSPQECSWRAQCHAFRLCAFVRTAATCGSTVSREEASTAVLRGSCRVELDDNRSPGAADQCTAGCRYRPPPNHRPTYPHTPVPTGSPARGRHETIKPVRSRPICLCARRALAGVAEDDEYRGCSLACV